MAKYNQYTTEWFIRCYTEMLLNSYEFIAGSLNKKKSLSDEDISPRERFHLMELFNTLKEEFQIPLNVKEEDVERGFTIPFVYDAKGIDREEALNLIEKLYGAKIIRPTHNTVVVVLSVGTLIKKGIFIKEFLSWNGFRDKAIVTTN